MRLVEPAGTLWGPGGVILRPGGVWLTFLKLSTRLHQALKVPHKACRTWWDLVEPWWGHFKAWWGLVGSGGVWWGLVGSGGPFSVTPTTESHALALQIVVQDGRIQGCINIIRSLIEHMA